MSPEPLAAIRERHQAERSRTIHTIPWREAHADRGALLEHIDSLVRELGLCPMCREGEHGFHHPDDTRAEGCPCREGACAEPEQGVAWRCGSCGATWLVKVPHERSVPAVGGMRRFLPCAATSWVQVQR